MPANLDRRVQALEEAFQPPPERFVIAIVPMVRPGRAFVPCEYRLPDGTTVERGAEESVEAFETRANALALAATTGVPIIYAGRGEEVFAT